MRRAAFLVSLALASGVLVAGSLRAAPSSKGPNDPALDGPLYARTGFVFTTLTDGTLLTSTVRLPLASWTPRPVVLVIHGYAVTGVDYSWIADHLATRGFAAVLVETKNPYEANFEVWATQVIATLDALGRANANPWSGLFGELDMKHVALVGHSYGGTTAIATAARDARVKCVAALEPGAVPSYQPQLLARAASVMVPLLVVGGQLDTICPPAVQGVPIFQAATAAPSRLYVEIGKADHLGFLDFEYAQSPVRPYTETHAIASRYFTGWLETELLGRADPDGYADGRAATRDVSAGDLTRFIR